MTKFLILLASLLWLAGCGPDQINLDGQTMGTHYSVKYLNHPSSPDAQIDAQIVQQEIDQRLALINSQMSTYQSDSELSRFNQSRETDKPFPVSAATARVVRESLRISQLTDGALDITIGPLVNLWGFGPPGRTIKAPAQADIDTRKALSGADKLQLAENTLIKHIPELYVDLSSIAKGYGVDVIADYLQSQSLYHYLVDIGGEVRTRGNNGLGQPWRIAIETPNTDTEQRAQRIVTPGAMAIATSGDYRNYFEENGVRYSHTVDPKTGRPVSHSLVSVSVLHPSCMTADGIATGLNVLGPEKGMALANLLAIPVFMIVKTDQGFEERSSDAFKPYLQQK